MLRLVARLSIWPVLLAAFALLLVVGASAQAAFPGTNGKFVVAANADLYTFNPDGSGLTNVTNSGGALGPGFPAWSADGRRIAFASDTADPGFFLDIFVVNADGTGLTNLTNNPDSFDTEPTWSPDGSKIAFSANLTGSGFEIYTMNADGSDLTNLTHSGFSFTDSPSWSPDGTRIAFRTERDPDNFNSAIWLVNADGSGQFDVTQNSDFNGYVEPNWAPDGSKIVFASSGPSPPSLITINPDGTGQAPVPGLNDSERYPRWSPDGQKIAFLSAGGLATINIDGTGQSGPLPVAGTFDWAPIPPNRPPDCSGVAASRTVLTTVNRRLIALTLDGATDPDGDPVSLTVDGVTQDEPVESSGDATSPDAIDEGEGELRIRAERNPGGDGRVYRIAFTATDGRDGSCSGVAKVAVPRHRKKPAVDSAPPSYDSFSR